MCRLGGRPPHQVHTQLLAKIVPPVLGLGGLLALWWLGGYALSINPRLSGFTGFAPGPAFAAFWKLLGSGEALEASIPSLYRIVSGLSLAFVFGAVLGIIIGLSPILERAL